MPATVKDLFKKIDGMVFRVERSFVVLALVVMSVVVFFDVIHRTFASDDNKGVAAFVKFLSYFGTIIERDTPSYVSLEQWLPYVLWAGFVALGFFALRTANTRTKIEPLRALAFSAAGVVVTYGLIRLFVTAMPNGIVWSQKLALVLTLWVGFVAASMCTYENRHLKVEAAQRAIPEPLKPYVVALSSLFTAAVCGGLMWLAMRYTLSAYRVYVKSDGYSGLFPGLDVASWKCFAVLPLSFFIMTIRFTARAVFALGGELPVSPGLEGIEALEKAEADAKLPSDVPTEAALLREADDAARPQSRVTADPHEDKPKADAKPAADTAGSIGERDDSKNEEDEA